MVEEGWGGERDRDLQTNLITSLQNGITLLASELLTSLKESKEQRGKESGILKIVRVETGRTEAVLKDKRKFEMYNISFSHYCYQGVCFTPKYPGERDTKNQEGMSEKKNRRREMLARDGMEDTETSLI